MIIHIRSYTYEYNKSIQILKNNNNAFKFLII